MQLSKHIEALIFAADTPIKREEIRSVLETHLETTISAADLEAAYAELLSKYSSDDFVFEIVEIADGFKFLSKGAYHGTIGTYLKQNAKKKLSQAALETLSIIAYKQPVSKSEVEQIRGVNCDYAVQKLLEKELIAIAGRSESAGRPLLYATSSKFMDYFGIKNIKELPKPKDIKEASSEIGA
ncbi:MAG: SMC-Scp complex subunit ScpB [Bacteroidota bacterium]|jgi:segregation and condensation protein B